VKTIICTTRGGEASVPNQDRAILLAKELDSKLVFLHVTNVEFLDQFASPVLVDMEEELQQLGEFVLQMAIERAEKAELSAEAVCKSGSFAEAVLESIHEEGADILTLGSPSGNTASTTLPFLKELIQHMQKETDIEIIVLHDGEILERHSKH
jgi:nucleotide-binding universal stress UspA family protein